MGGQGNDEFVDIILIDPGSTPNAIFNVAAKFNRLSLTPAQYRDLLKTLPQPLCVSAPRPQAEALKLEMESFGAVVELRASPRL